MTYPKRPVAVVPLSTGETVRIEPFTAKHLIFDDKVPDALEQVGVFLRKTITEAVSNVAVDEHGNIGAAELLSAIEPERLLSRECRKPLIVLLRAAVDNPDEWWEYLELDDLIALAAGVFRVNAEHNGKKLAASLTKLFAADTPLNA